MPYGQQQGIRDAPPDDMAPVLEWDDFMTYVIGSSAKEHRWAQNQHAALIGPTDSGKSTLLHGILPLRSYTTMFGTKIKDDTLQAYVDSGYYSRLQSWPPTKRKWYGGSQEVSAREMPRRLLWPDVSTLDAVKNLGSTFRPAVDDIYGRGGWCVVWDEFWMQCEILGMKQDAKILLQQARSNDIAMVMGMQRPVWIPPEVFDQTRHLFFWRDNDEPNLKRIGNVGWLNAGPIRSFVASLEPYQVLYINNRTGNMYRTRAPELSLAA
jgi:energy-coupling factor transporter ATP-binding protein EcfA2